MNNHQGFITSRRRLAGLYIGSMGTIFFIFTFIFYRSVVDQQWQFVNRKLATVAGTLHDGIEPALEKPGQIEPIVDHFLPGLVCLNDTPCPPKPIERYHIAGLVQEDEYYVRFIDPNGKTLAFVGHLPSSIPLPLKDNPWQTIKTKNDSTFRQVSLFLKTVNQLPWGFIQVGYSLKGYEDYLTQIRWIMVLGLPIGMILVTGAGWYLSGLALQPAFKSFRQIQQFTADAAHELRTPLATIRSAIEFTLDEPQLLESETRHTLQMVKRQNDRLSVLVQDLLLLSRIEHQTNSIDFGLCCLNNIMNDILEDFSFLANESGIDLLFNLKTGQDLYVWGNETHLYRVFANLINNALQYTPQQEKVRITLTDQGDRCVVTVEDRGIGIPANEQVYIFDRFYRVNSDRARTTGGAGLGLAIAKAIVECHKGNITFVSKCGEGSKFSVCLPLKKLQ